MENEARTADRPEPRERVQDVLAEVTALLRKNRLVEGLIHDQLEHAPSAEQDELAQSAVARQNKEQLARVRVGDEIFGMHFEPSDGGRAGRHFVEMRQSQADARPEGSARVPVARNGGGVHRYAFGRKLPPTMRSQYPAGT